MPGRRLRSIRGSAARDAGEEVAVTKIATRRFKRRSSLRLKLRLNAVGRQMVRQLGSLDIVVRSTVTDGSGAVTNTELQTVVKKGATGAPGPGGGGTPGR